MNAHPASTEMGRGRGNAPFPSAPSPKITLGRLHKTLDTPELLKYPVAIPLFDFPSVTIDRSNIGARTLVCPEDLRKAIREGCRSC